jgi:hypothetical protein
MKDVAKQVYLAAEGARRPVAALHGILQLAHRHGAAASNANSSVAAFMMRFRWVSSTGVMASGTGCFEASAVY